MRIVKNAFEDIVQYFKNKMFSSKYVLKGKCKQCGKCCRNILFSDENGYIKDEESFRSARKTNGKYLRFEVSGRVENEDPMMNGALLFKCKSLSESGKCTRYFFRPLWCRDYPAINPDFIYNGGETLDGCGFYFDVDKKFKDYLN